MYLMIDSVLLNILFILNYLAYIRKFLIKNSSTNKLNWIVKSKMKKFVFDTVCSIMSGFF